MPTLHLFRHAKSSWGEAGTGDHDRSLAPRGRKAAPAMARRMVEQGVAPTLILVSTARRCQETLALLQPVVAKRARVMSEEALYLASADDLLERLRRIGDADREVMLIGHNPGFHDLALRLLGQGSDAERARLAEKFPTAALASLSSEAAGWAELVASSMRLLRFLRPADLPEL